MDKPSNREGNRSRILTKGEDDMQLVVLVLNVKGAYHASEVHQVSVGDTNGFGSL